MSLHETVLPMFRTSMYIWIGSPISLKSAFDISFDNCSEHKIKAKLINLCDKLNVRNLTLLL